MRWADSPVGELTTAGPPGSNSPVYDGEGNRIVLGETWRIPQRPLRRPRHCDDKRASRIGWNMYRCPVCASRIEPERLYHRLMLTRNPFRIGEKRPFRNLVRVVRWHRVTRDELNRWALL